MLAAGWGGTSHVRYLRSKPILKSDRLEDEDIEIPSYMRRHYENMQTLPANQKVPASEKAPAKPLDFIHVCNGIHKDLDTLKLHIQTYQDLLNHGLPGQVISTLKAIARQYKPPAPESFIIAVFLHVMANSALGGSFHRNTKRIIKRTVQRIAPDKELINLMEQNFVHITANDWSTDTVCHLG